MEFANDVMSTGWMGQRWGSQSVLIFVFFQDLQHYPLRKNSHDISFRLILSSLALLHSVLHSCKDNGHIMRRFINELGFRKDSTDGKMHTSSLSALISRGEVTFSAPFVTALRPYPLSRSHRSGDISKWRWAKLPSLLWLSVCRSRGLTWKTERRKNDISNERGRELSSR